MCIKKVAKRNVSDNKIKRREKTVREENVERERLSSEERKTVQQNQLFLSEYF